MNSARNQFEHDTASGTFASLFTECFSSFDHSTFCAIGPVPRYSDLEGIHLPLSICTNKRIYSRALPGFSSFWLCSSEHRIRLFPIWFAITSLHGAFALPRPTFVGVFRSSRVPRSAGPAVPVRLHGNNRQRTGVMTLRNFRDIFAFPVASTTLISVSQYSNFGTAPVYFGLQLWLSRTLPAVREGAVSVRESILLRQQ